MMTVEKKENLAVALFQICSTDSFEKNSEKILEMLKEVVSRHEIDLCVLPENALYINIQKKDKPPVIDFDHHFFNTVAELCKKHEFALHLGSVPRYVRDQLYNSTVFINEKGELSFPYDKIHLFAAQVGSLSIDEGAQYAAGEEPALLDIKGWKVGLSICFDLRFSELYSFYAKSSVDLILVPSAFFRVTGKAHWEILLRARAIESQAYVIAPGQVGVHSSEDHSQLRKSYGHSLFIHPWGDVLSDLGEEKEQFEVLKLENKEIQKMRSSIMMNRKLV